MLCIGTVYSNYGNLCVTLLSLVLGHYGVTHSEVNDIE